MLVFLHNARQRVTLGRDNVLNAPQLEQEMQFNRLFISNLQLFRLKLNQRGALIHLAPRDNKRVSASVNLFPPVRPMSSEFQ